MGITISTLICPDEVKEKLVQEEEYLSQVGINFIFNEDKMKDYTLFKIDSDRVDYLKELKKYLADMVAEVVVDSLEKKLVNNIIKKNYQQFNLDERSKIEGLALDHLNKDNRIEDQFFSKFIRKSEIITHILNYLEQNQDLNIEGFVRFRLKDYIDQLRLAVERAVDDYIIEREYNEFVDLLKYFVDLQEPKVSVVNVLKKEDGSFLMLDDREKIIDNEYLEGYIAEIMDGEVEFEDLLVSALINVSPGEIVLHFIDNEVEKTVRNIFSDRVVICEGCSLCRKD